MFILPMIESQNGNNLIVWDKQNSYGAGLIAGLVVSDRSVGMCRKKLTIGRRGEGWEIQGTLIETEVLSINDMKKGYNVTKE